MRIAHRNSFCLVGAVVIALTGGNARGQSSPADSLVAGAPQSSVAQASDNGEAPALVRFGAQAFAGTGLVESFPSGPPASAAQDAIVVANTTSSADVQSAFDPVEDPHCNWVGGAGGNCAARGCSPGFFAGADFLFVRPHFSEATAFAQGSIGPTGLAITGQELNFNYEASFRVFAGYRFAGDDSELQFTYTRLPGQVDVDAGTPGPGHFLIDPFGNVVGTAPVVNPNSALFGKTIVGGDSIQTQASVTVNAYDVELVKPIVLPWSQWVLRYSLGVRIADIDQSYQSVIDSGGAFFSGGQYTVDYVGAGPRVGLQGERYFGHARSWSLFANAYASLLVGEYNENFSQTTTAPPFAATQSTKIIRTVPVAEIEAGGSWSPCSWFKFSAGWLFQAWFDMGTSGGTFGGYYVVTENANIMSFEGLFVRGEIAF